MRSGDLLVYANIGAIPFDLKFNMVDDGMTIKIGSPLGNDVLTVPADALTGMSNFTDPSECYVSISPWATKTTMSVEVTAVHTEEDVVDEPIVPDTPMFPVIRVTSPRSQSLISSREFGMQSLISSEDFLAARNKNHMGGFVLPYNKNSL